MEIIVRTPSLIKILCYMITLLICGAVLTGCDNGQDRIKKYIAEIKKRPPSRVKPLPKIKKPEQFAYVATNKRSPFERLIKKRSEINLPDMNRPKEPLEQYSLDSLKMVGVFTKDKIRWALIATKDGQVIPVKVGNYLGKNFGEITNIEENEVLIEETIREQDGWAKRSSSIMLREK